MPPRPSRRISPTVRFAAGFLGVGSLAVLVVLCFVLKDRSGTSDNGIWFSFAASVFCAVAFLHAAISGESPRWLEQPASTRADRDPMSVLVEVDGGWYTADPALYRFLTSHNPPRPGTVWQYLRTEFASPWRGMPLLGMLVVFILLGLAFLISRWEPAILVVLMIVALVRRLPVASAALRDGFLSESRLDGIEPVVKDPRHSTAVIEVGPSTQRTKLVTFLDTDIAEHFMAHHGSVEILCLCLTEGASPGALFIAIRDAGRR